MEASSDAGSWRVRARNIAVASDNKIHDDAVARAYGFAGGLVPGVDVYAYMTHLPAARWGLPWLERGTMTARFHRPVYDGDEVEVEATTDIAGDADPTAVLTLTLRSGGSGEVCATGVAGLPPGGGPGPDPDAIQAGVSPAVRPPASPESLPIGGVLGSIERRWHKEKAAAYLADVGESLDLYRREVVAHPGWLLRSANWILADNVRLGPWIHVSSAVTHHGVVHDGERVTTRARVTDRFERKGHGFVVLDVLLATGDRTVLRAEHTAIYEPRRADYG